MVFIPHWPSISAQGKRDVRRMKQILTLLDNPQHHISNVIYVVGTNGKGSNVKFLQNILRANDFTVNSYTGPHLLRINENIILNNKEIADENLYFYLEKIRLATKNYIRPSFFEAMTAVACLAFAEHKADFNIVESGLGAKNDPTNIFENQNYKLTIITPISYDHTATIGPSIFDIALEKSFAIKNNIPVVIASQYPEVQNLLCEKAKKHSAKTIIYEIDYDYQLEKDTFFFVDIPHKEMIEFDKSKYMLGEHQLQNLSTALAATCQLIKIDKLKHQETNVAINNTKFYCRMEKIINHQFNSLLPKNSELWIDGAHNEAGAFMIKNWLLQKIQINSQEEKHTETDQTQQTISHRPEQTITDEIIEKNLYVKSKNTKENHINLQNIIIIGRSKNTDQLGFISQFKDVANKIICVRVKGEVFPEDEHIIAKTCDELNIDNVIASNLYEAIDWIKDNYQKQVRVIICGSLYLYRDLHGIFVSEQNKKNI